MNVGELENVKAMVFLSNRTQPQSGTLVVESQPSDFLEFRKTYGLTHEATRAEIIEQDGTGKLWFMVYVEDCFSPPVCVVRADNASEAEEAFVNVKDWADVQEPDASDYPEDALHATERGTMYDPESVCVREVFLSRIEF